MKLHLRTVSKIAILALAGLLAAIALPRSIQRSIQQAPAGFYCEPNIPALTNPKHDDTAPGQSTELRCSHPLDGVLVRLNSLSDLSRYIDHSNSRNEGSTFNLGYNLTLSAHSGLNRIQVVLSGRFSTSFEFNFRVDDQSPILRIDTSVPNPSVHVIDSDSPITSIKAITSVGGIFKELELMHYGTQVPGLPSTPRQLSFLLPSAFTGDTLITATDSAGNSSELYLGSLPIEKFRTALHEYREAEYSALVEAARASQFDQAAGSYGLKLAMLLLVPTQLSDADMVERLIELHSTIAIAAQRLEDEFLLQQRPVPGLKVNSMANLVVYVRRVGETSAREVKLDALLSGTLAYGQVLDNLEPFPRSSFREFQDASGNWGVGIDSDGSDAAIRHQEKPILNAAFPIGATGAERLLVFVDNNLDGDWAGVYLRGTQTAFVCRQEDGGMLSNRKTEVERDPVVKTIIHELGHSVGLSHAYMESEFDLVRKGLFLGGNTYMLGFTVQGTQYLTYSQVVAFQFRFFGLPEGWAQKNYPGDFLSMASGFEQITPLDIENYHLLGAGVPAREFFPVVSPGGGDIPPRYRDQRLVLPLLPEPFYFEFPPIVYGSQPSEDTEVLMPKRIDRNTAQLAKDYPYNNLSEDKFDIKAGTKVIHLGFIPLANGVFEPFYDGVGLNMNPLIRSIPRNSRDWDKLSGRGVNALEIAVQPGQNDFTIDCEINFSFLKCTMSTGDWKSRNITHFTSHAMVSNGVQRIVPFALVIRPSELKPIRSHYPRFNAEEFADEN